MGIAQGDDMNKDKIISSTILFLLLMLPSAYAICPVCIVLVGGGLELAKLLGVDDAIAGIWIGGLILSFALWLVSWLEKKNVKLGFGKIAIVALIYIATLVPLYLMKIIGYSYKIWGIDKALLGITVGSVAFYVGVLVNNMLKIRNLGKGYFQFQKVIIPILHLIIVSVVFYLTMG